MKDIRNEDHSKSRADPKMRVSLLDKAAKMQSARSPIKKPVNGCDAASTSYQSQDNAKAQIALEILRKELMKCREVDPKGEAMRFALKTIDDVERSYCTPGSSRSQDEKRSGQSRPTLTCKPTNGRNMKVSRNGNGHRKAPTSALEKKKNVSEMKARFSIANIFFFAVRFILIELPIVAIFLLGAITASLSYVYDEYLNPQFDLMTYTEQNRTRDQTYYHRVCTPNDITTNDPADLLIEDDFTTQECLEHMMVHGMSMYQNILKPDTADNLRTWILQRNKSIKKGDEIGVIANENRWSFFIGTNEDPAVTKALQEITTHEVFRPALEKIVGRNPAIIEMTAITSAFGAEDQFWHPDVVPGGSPAKYARSFIPSYALFIALQDISSEMGATDVCPGTFMCGEEADMCEGHSFQVSGKNGWKSGDAIFMNQQSYHRGPAHKDPHGPERSLFIITFSPRPQEMDVETRMLGQGGSYSLRKDMWGHALDDFEHSTTKIKQPWSTLRALGIWKPADSEWGYDWITQNSMRIANSDTGYYQNQLIEFARAGHMGLPKFLAPVVDERTEWRDYFRETVKLWEDIMYKANIIVSAVYVTLAVFIGIMLTVVRRKKDDSSVSPMKSTFASIFRVVVLDGIIVLFTLWAVDCTGNSKWGQAITSRTLYGSPFSEPLQNQPEEPNSNLAVVSFADVLISDKFDINYLNTGGVNWLDFQGGNMNLKSKLKGASFMFKNLNERDRERLVESVFDGLKREGSRLLYHDEYAEWLVLSDVDSTKYISKALHLEVNPLMAFLDMEGRFLISNSKHGRRMNSAMGRKYSLLYMNAFMETLFQKAGIPHFSMGKSMDLLKRKVPYSSSVAGRSDKSGNSHLLKVNRKNIIQPLKINSRVVQRIVPSLPTQVVVTDELMLKLGDVVEVMYNGKHNEVSSFTHKIKLVQMMIV